MIIPDDPPEAPDKVFMLATPAHMLSKLHWELYRLKKSLTEKPEFIGHIHAPSYCAFNFAVTAWALADWTWQSASAEERKYIFECLRIKSRPEHDKAFGKFQEAVREKSRAIHICQQIANGSKHMKIDRNPDPDVQAKMRWETEPARVDTLTGDPLATFQQQLVVVDKGEEQSAVKVFEDAFKDWQRLLGAWGFVEGTPVPASR